MSKYAKTAGLCSQWGIHPHEMYDDHYAEGLGEITLNQYEPPLHETFRICWRCADENWGPGSGLRVDWDPRFRWLVVPVFK